MTTFGQRHVFSGMVVSAANRVRINWAAPTGLVGAFLFSGTTPLANLISASATAATVGGGTPVFNASGYAQLKGSTNWIDTGVTDSLGSTWLTVAATPDGESSPSTDAVWMSTVNGGSEALAGKQLAVGGVGLDQFQYTRTVGGTLGQVSINTATARSAGADASPRFIWASTDGATTQSLGDDTTSGNPSVTGADSNPRVIGTANVLIGSSRLTNAKQGNSYVWGSFVWNQTITTAQRQAMETQLRAIFLTLPTPIVP
jgi:hypothetical protein